MIVSENSPKYRETHTLVAATVPVPCDERAGAIPEHMFELDVRTGEKIASWGTSSPHPGRGLWPWRGAAQAALAFTVAAGWLVLLAGTSFSGIVLALGLLVVLAVLK